MSNVDEKTKQEGEWIEIYISDLLSEGSKLRPKAIKMIEEWAHQYGDRGWLFNAQAKTLESIWSERFGFAHNR